MLDHLHLALLGSLILNAVLVHELLVRLISTVVLLDLFQVSLPNVRVSVVCGPVLVGRALVLVGRAPVHVLWAWYVACVLIFKASVKHTGVVGEVALGLHSHSFEGVTHKKVLRLNVWRLILVYDLNLVCPVASYQKWINRCLCLSLTIH